MKTGIRERKKEETRETFAGVIAITMITLICNHIRYCNGFAALTDIV